MRAAVETEGLGLSLGGRPVLRDVTLSVRPEKGPHDD